MLTFKLKINFYMESFVSSIENIINNTSICLPKDDVITQYHLKILNDNFFEIHFLLKNIKFFISGNGYKYKTLYVDIENITKSCDDNIEKLNSYLTLINKYEKKQHNDKKLTFHFNRLVNTYYNLFFCSVNLHITKLLSRINEINETILDDNIMFS
jgi:hypothetical protein